MQLYIAEKPSLAQAIAHGLGKGHKEEGCFVMNGGQQIVTWCYGHILENLKPNEYDPKYEKWNMADLPICPVHWKLKISESCKKQFHIIQRLIARADEIVHAGDPDKEGQLLVDEVLGYVENTKPVKRILLNALDEKSVHAALTDLRNNQDFYGMRDAALARSRADWLIGMNLSRFYTLKAREAGYSSAMNVGRVQTPTAALVVRREKEIHDFKPVTHYQVQVVWQHANGTLPSIWQCKEDVNGLDAEGRLLNRDVAENLLLKIKTVTGYSQAKILKFEKKEKQLPQRLPYSLSALQIDAGKRFGYSPQQVLDTMQQLYEKKLTTYPRSDCDYLPENQFSDATEILSHVGSIAIEGCKELAANADISIHSRAWNDKKITAHHAIIPTRSICDFASLEKMQQDLYRMVCQAYLAQFFPIHQFLATKIWIQCSDETFTATGKHITVNGWKDIYRQEKSVDAEAKDEEIELPAVMEQDAVQFFSGSILEKITKPPARFTPATLLKAMKEIYKYVKEPALKIELKECSGIGTEATRAGIIDKLQTSSFLRLEKKYLLPMEKANMLVEVLPEEFTYPDTTAVWEQSLELIEKNNLGLNEFISKQIDGIHIFMEQAKNVQITSPQNVVRCPKCHKPMTRRKSAKGYFWGCTGYPDCKETAADKKGKPCFNAQTAKHKSKLGTSRMKKI
jgi:DNA topoisomerase III